MIRAKVAYNGQIFRMQLEPMIRLEELMSIVCTILICTLYTLLDILWSYLS